MDVQLSELIDKIKSEGVKPAEQEADEILKNAKKEADTIREQAKSDAEETRRKAKEDAEQMEQSGRAALEQAGRDLLLSLRDRIQNVFESIILSEVRETMDTEVLGRAILALVSSWDTADAENLEVVLSETDRDSLEKMLRAKLSEAMKAGMTISTSKRVKAGFQVGYKDGSAYYDISDQGLAELLSEHLNPRLAESIQKAAKKE